MHPAAGTLPQNPLEEVTMAKRRLSMRKIEEVRWARKKEVNLYEKDRRIPAQLLLADLTRSAPTVCTELSSIGS
jgi:hypothetical protein